jgi:uncharacterized membrane protein
MPRLYKPMVPPYLPAPAAVVYASGAAQIAGGAGLITHSTRRAAGWWLIATLIAMFPANVHMAMNPDEYPGFPGGATALWARLPLQGAFIAWVRAAMQADDVPQQ